MSTRRANEAELIEVLDQFCSGFASRDADAVLSVCALDPDLIVVTSEEPLLRGPVELRGFLDRYHEGDTTYSWEWDRHDVSIAGSLAWLLAEGAETAASEEGLALRALARVPLEKSRAARVAVWRLLLDTDGGSKQQQRHEGRRRLPGVVRPAMSGVASWTGALIPRHRIDPAGGDAGSV